MNGYVTLSGPAGPADITSVPVKRKSGNCLNIYNLPQTLTKEQIDSLLSTFGTVQKSSQVTSATAGSFVGVTYETRDMAQRAFTGLNNFNYDGSQLKVEFSQPPNAANRQNKPRPRNSGFMGNSRPNTYPVRILVPSDLVGAIIGRKGQTIRAITTRCKARVDVHGKENPGLIEKVISIYGQPENCTNACKEILQVMQQESSNNGRGEIILKMLSDDRYCGRIIGKEGKMIKKIRDETATKITVSNAQEMAAIYPDRVITIKGALENMSKAEAAISVKLTECIEQDAQTQMNMQTGMMMPPAMPGMSMGHPGAGIYPGMRPFEPVAPGYYPPMYGGGAMQPPQPMPIKQAIDSCHIVIPNAAVGAIIGAGGTNIKQIMRDSSAYVNIETRRESDPSAERTVMIKGTPDACWKASYLVFEKMKMEGFAGNDDVRLKTGIRVPKMMVGRVIGKGGKNVRELQRTTGAMIKLPEDPASQGDEVVVEVFGNFMATQSAHSRIRALVSQSHQPPFNGVGPRVGPRGANRQPPAPPQQPPPQELMQQ